MARVAKDLDLIGTKVGRLEVIKKAEDRVSVDKNGYNRTKRYWLCSCECGNTCEVRQDAILGNTTKSCGCLRDEAAKEQIKKAQAVGYKRKKKDLTGLLFGRLTVVSEAESIFTPKNRELHRWECSCSCGNSFVTLHDSLIQNKATSCGCVPPSLVDSEFKSKTDVFIYKAKQAHGDRFDYSLTNFEHSQKYITVVCYEHGQFLQKPSNHLNGHGCPACVGREPLTDSSQARKLLFCGKHSRKYSSDLGCKLCAKESLKSTKETFLLEAEAIHGNKYDYSRVEDFTTKTEKITIVCPEHGEFRQRVSEHLKGKNCSQCAYKLLTKTTEEFIEEAKVIHGETYDYSLVKYVHCDTPIEIICKEHGAFLQKPSFHISGGGHGCKLCSTEARARKQHWNYIKRCELNTPLANSRGTLYLIELTHEDEKFLKVGISSNPVKRLARYKEQGLSYEILCQVHSTSLQTALWEQDVLREVKQLGFKYIPEVEFKGWTECATLDAQKFLVDYFSKLEIEYGSTNE